LLADKKYLALLDGGVMVFCLVTVTRYEEKQHVIESINILANPEKAIIQAPTTKNQHPFPNR
jgi:hypothetical protein